MKNASYCLALALALVMCAVAGSTRPERPAAPAVVSLQGR